MDLSIIVVNYNTKDLLDNCLFSILQYAKKMNFEVIVIDNASQDSSITMLEEKYPLVKIIENNQNLGFAKANNQGLQIAHGQLILFLNPDTVVLPQALEKTIEFLKKTPDAGMAGCKILNPDGSLQYSCRSFPSFWNYFFESFFLYKLFPKNHRIGKFYMTNFSYDRVKEVDVVLGAFMMSKKETLDKVGYFDEDFFIYSEETDLCYRMKKHNKKVYFFPDAQIIHYGRASASLYPVRMFQQDHRSRFLFMRKHYSAINILFSTWIIFIGVFLRIIFWSWATGYAFFLNKSFLKNSKIKLKVFVNLFIWYLGLKFAR
jgi:GT2 family glycosyltransferase